MDHQKEDQIPEYQSEAVWSNDPVAEPSTSEAFANDVPTPSESVYESPVQVAWAAPTPEPIEQDVQSWNTPNVASKKTSLFSASRAYLAEYALVLILTTVVLGIIGSMLNTIMQYIGSGRPLSSFSSYAYTASVAMLSGLIVSLPALFLFTRRTKQLEQASPSVKLRSWRKGFLGFFIIATSLYALGYSAAFVYELVSYFASMGIGGEKASFPWRGLIGHSITAIVFIGTTWLYAYDYRNQENDKETVARFHRYGLTIIAGVLALIYLIVPFRAQRADFIDGAISADLSSIQTKISNYASKNGNLPKSLDKLTLSDKEKANAKSFKYTYKADTKKDSYQLCANFKTNTKDKDRKQKGVNPLESFTSPGYDDTYKDDAKDDPYVHDSGKGCFEGKGYSTYDTYDFGSSKSPSSRSQSGGGSLYEDSSDYSNDNGDDYGSDIQQN